MIEFKLKPYCQDCMMFESCDNVLYTVVYFKATDSKDSAGVAGKPIGSLHEHFL